MPKGKIKLVYCSQYKIESIFCGCVVLLFGNPISKVNGKKSTIKSGKKMVFSIGGLFGSWRKKDDE